MNDVLELNKNLVERPYRECINIGKLDTLRALIGEEFVGSRREKRSVEFGSTILSLRASFPDAHFAPGNLVAENDRVVARWRMEDTHLGPFAGFPASHKPVKQTAIVIYQIRDGKIVRTWQQPDSLGLMQQIGALPPLAVAAPRA